MNVLIGQKTIFYGGTILTINEKEPEVEALGIVGEKIAITGSLDTVKNSFVADYEMVDLKGHTLLPGFIDCHLHPIIFTYYKLSPNLSKISSLSELKSYLKDITKGKPKDELIICFNLKEENFDIPELPTRWDLDDVCPDHPIFVMRYDSHIGIANSRALELANINENTSKIEGGEIKKGNDGKINGIISEKAVNLMLAKMSFPEVDLLNEVAIRVFEELAEKGITSLHGILSAGTGSEFGSVGAVEIPLRKSFQDYILQNWYAFINTEKPNKLHIFKKPPLDEGRNDSKFKVGGLKLYLDGIFGAKTAYMFEAFSDDLNNVGYCVIGKEEIYEKMKEAHNQDFQIAIHAIGDKGNRIVMDLYKRLLSEFPRENHRHRIEHASMLTEDVLEDMARYKIIASCQPPFITSEYKWLPKRLGIDRCKYTYPMKSILDHGIILISGSDCPIEDPNPILGLHALVTRNGFVPEQCITIEEALKSYTINAAYAAFEEDIKGTLEPGKLADMVILDKNPLEVPKEEIKNLQILETIIRGKTVYKRIK
jgi:predicted amidohydrolase YtcJ